MADTGHEHPSVWTLLGSPDAAVLKSAEQVYTGECTLAPSVLPHRQQEECMRILHQELGKCMSRAGLQSKTGPARTSLRSWRCSCSHSASQTWSLSARPQGAKSAKRLREDTPVGWSDSRRRWTHSRRRSRLRWHQSPSPPCHIQHQSPLPSPPQSLPPDEQLSNSMEHLLLQQRPCKSRSREW